MTRTEKVWAAAGGVLATVLVGVGIWEETKSKPAPGGTQNVNLVQGHRYSIAFQCGASNASPAITALTGISLVSATPNANGTGGTIVVDYSGTTGTYPVTTSGCSITVSDMGVSPGVSHGTPIGGVHGIPLQTGQGGVQLSQLPLSQSLLVTTNGAYGATAVQNGTLQISAPWMISSIEPSPTVNGPISGVSSFGDSANITLSGKPGTIKIWGPKPSSHAISAKVSAMIKVT